MNQHQDRRMATLGGQRGRHQAHCQWWNDSAIARACMAVLLMTGQAAWASGGTSCTMNTPTVAFGNFNSLSVFPTDTVGTISITCNQASAPYQITFDGGATGSAATWREMSHQPTTSIRLEYNLYSDAGRTVVWASNSGGSGVGVSGTTGAISVPTNLNVYGRIRPGPQQTQRPLLKAGSYLDNITVTYTF